MCYKMAFEIWIPVVGITADIIAAFDNFLQEKVDYYRSLILNAIFLGMGRYRKFSSYGFNFKI